MKSAPLAAAAALVLFFPGHGHAGDMTLQFTNGDLVRGDLLGFGESGLLWESDAFAGPQRFRIDPVSQIELPTSGGHLCGLPR